MPRKRKRGKERRRSLTPEDFGVREVLQLKVGWHPPEPNVRARSRWRTWEECRDDWEALREHLMPSPECPEGGLYRAEAGRRPFAWWRFDSPEPRQVVREWEVGYEIQHFAYDPQKDGEGYVSLDREYEPQHEQLARLRMLEDWERDFLAVHPPEPEYVGYDEDEEDELGEGGG